MENKTLRNVEGYSLAERKAKSNYYQLTFNERGRKLPHIFNSVDNLQRHFDAFLTSTGGSLGADHHYEVLSKILENPSVLLDPNFPPNYQFIKDHHIEVLVVIALGVEANTMFIKPGEQLFRIDLSEYSGNEERVRIGPPLTGPSPERIQQIIANFRQVNDFPPPKGVTINKVLPEMMRRIGIRIVASNNKDVFLNLQRLADSYAMHRLVEAREFPYVIPTVPLNEVTVLVPSEYGATYLAPFTLSAITTLYESQHQSLTNRIIHRKVMYLDAFDTIDDYFEVSEEPTNPNEVTRQLEGAGANTNAAELDEEGDDLSDGGDMGDNNDYMDFPPDDVDPPVDAPEQPGDDMMVGPNEPHTPAHSPNPDRAADTHPNADSNNGDSTDSEQNSPEAPTARKRGARRDDRNAKRRKTSSRKSKKKAKKSRHRSNSGRGESGSTDVHESPIFTALEELLQYKFDTLNTSVASGFDDLKTNVANEFDDLNTNVANEFDDLNTNVANGFDDLNTNVANEFDDLNTNVANGFDDLNTNVANGFDDLNTNVAAEFDDLNTNVNALNNNVTALNTNVFAGLYVLNTNAAAGFNALNTNVATRFDAMDTNIATRFDALNTNVATRFDAMDTNVATRFDAMETNIAAGFNALNTNVAAGLYVLNTNAAAGFNALNTNIATRFNAMETNIAAGFDAMDTNIAAGFDAMDTNVATRFDAMDTNVATRFDAIDTNISALRAEIVNNRANQAQCGTEAGPQTNVSGEGGATDALGAGAIPRPVISSPDSGQTEGEDEVQAEIAGEKDYYKNHAIFVCIFIAILVLVYNPSLCYKAVQTDGIAASPSSDIQPPRINCDDGIEVAAAFCREKKCDEKVQFYCHEKRYNPTVGIHEHKEYLKKKENEIISQYM